MTIPREDIIIDGMAKSIIFSSMDLVGVKDVPYNAVSTPSDKLWEYLVIPQGLFNASTTCNISVTYLLRSV